MPERKKKKVADKFTKEMNKIRDTGNQEYYSISSRLPKNEDYRHSTTPGTVRYYDNKKPMWEQSGLPGSLKKDKQADITEPVRTGIDYNLSEQERTKKGSYDYYAQSQPVKKNMEADTKKKKVAKHKLALKVAISKENERANERKDKIAEINKPQDASPEFEYGDKVKLTPSSMWKLLKGGK